MSLSMDPAFSELKDRFVCGFKDITGESYAGRSGVHDVGGQAIKTTNGAGPHNLQLFVLAPDGTVLHALPGYWDSKDLVHELDLARTLGEVWADPATTPQAKAERFRELQLAHIETHPHDMVRRSRMQSFDMKYEARVRLDSSDTIADREMAAQALSRRGPPPVAAFKTTDRIVHERMSTRPFLPFDGFDVAAFVEYGRPKYDKHEDERSVGGPGPGAGSGSSRADLSALTPRERRMLRRQRRLGAGSADGSRAGSGSAP